MGWMCSWHTCQTLLFTKAPSRLQIPRPGGLLSGLLSRSLHTVLQKKCAQTQPHSLKDCAAAAVLVVVVVVVWD